MIPPLLLFLPSEFYTNSRKTNASLLKWTIIFISDSTDVEISSLQVLDFRTRIALWNADSALE